MQDKESWRKRGGARDDDDDDTCSHAIEQRCARRRRRDRFGHAHRELRLRRSDVGRELARNN